MKIVPSDILVATAFLYTRKGRSVKAEPGERFMALGKVKKGKISVVSLKWKNKFICPIDILIHYKKIEL